ncbi:OmpA family protein [Catalinimonas alkaloidigena]|uniref:OmpA family protein n=1 Tax=Catalinimonas alkaloidigena TaxID=1075417 RepID=UPI0015A42403|nr:OmpA family protein [Catalinimonas alkaloidigena]
MLTTLTTTVWAQDADLVAIADEQYNFGDKRDAGETYRQALGINPDNVRANYMAGICYLETIHKEKALTYLLKAYELAPEISPDILYLIARAYHYGEQFDEAIGYYQRYLSDVEAKKGQQYSKSKAQELTKQTERNIYECNVGKELMASPVPMDITSISEAVNTVELEYAPAITSDESFMIFTSRRAGGMSPDKANDNLFYEDIYITHRQNGKWNAPKLLEGVNTETHDASINISPDGSMLMLYQDDNGGDIFVSYKEKKEDEWSKPRPISDNVNSEFRESAASISADGKRLFFTSDRPGGYGGADIYMSEAYGKNKWGQPVNLGPAINSEYDDDSPVLSYDGTTLYFSSKGHRGMGGFDVFKSEWNDSSGTWMNAENLGYPINTPDDDDHYTVSADGMRAYYASVKDNIGVGDMDIFMITAKDPEEVDSVEAKKPQVAEKAPEKPAVAPQPQPELQPVVCQIVVTDATGAPLDAQIILQPATETGFESIKTGTFRKDFMLKESKAMQVTVRKEGYMFQTIDLTVPAAQAGKAQQITKGVRLQPVTAGVRRILRNIYFEFDKVHLRPESHDELAKLEQIMRENPTITVEIAGHTDKIGTWDYNKELSLRRAQSVRAWLIGRGIDGSRIKAVGYGETRPLASNDDEEEGRELNRRTEFVVLTR